MFNLAYLSSTQNPIDDVSETMSMFYTVYEADKCVRFGKFTIIWFISYVYT